MELGKVLRKLQWQQLKHDEAYHADVFVLPLAQHIKHLVLHFAKYTSYLFEAVEAQKKDQKYRTLVDAFAISLALANTLRQDLAKEMRETHPIVGSFAGIGREWAHEVKHSTLDSLWIVRTMALHTGQLAKACEALDHLEDIPFRTMMTNANKKLLEAVIVECAACSFDLLDGYNQRMREIEARFLFDKELRDR